MNKYLFLAFLTLSAYCQESASVMWSKKGASIADGEKNALLDYMEASLSYYGYSLISRNARDLTALIEESDLNASGITSSNDSVIGNLSYTGSLIVLSANQVGPDLFISSKYLRYPGGKIVMATKPVLLKKDLEEVSGNIMDQILSSRALSDSLGMPLVRINYKKPHKALPVWVKVSGYSSIATLVLSGVLFYMASNDYAQHKGAVTKETSDKYWNSFEEKRAWGYTFLIGSSAFALTWSAGF